MCLICMLPLSNLLQKSFRFQKRKMGLREIEIACGFFSTPTIQPKHKTKTLSHIRRRTTVMPRRTINPLVYRDEEELTDDTESYDFIEEEFLVEEEVETDPEIESTRSRSTIKMKSAPITETHSKIRSFTEEIPTPNPTMVRIEHDIAGRSTESDENSSSGSVNHAYYLKTNAVDVV